jgi:hypothetical protein
MFPWPGNLDPLRFAMFCIVRGDASRNPMRQLRNFIFLAELRSTQSSLETE